jgi:transcriptional regulator with XRE-family HTH domain
MEEIRRIRKERGLSQEVLAAKAGISPVTLIYAERAADEPGRPGRSHTPSLSTLRKIAKALEVSVNDLIDDPYAGMSAKELNEQGRKIREALQAATAAEDWGRVDALLAEGVRQWEEINILNPPLCVIHYTPHKRPQVTFFRPATEEELEDLEKKLGEYTVTNKIAERI